MISTMDVLDSSVNNTENVCTPFPLPRHCRSLSSFPSSHQQKKKKKNIKMLTNSMEEIERRFEDSSEISR